MFNWKKLCSNENSYGELQAELRFFGGVYILDDVKMPDTCGGVYCTIRFHSYSDNHIELVCEGAPFEYFGSDPDIRDWILTGTKEFDGFASLCEFLGKFKYDSVEESTPPPIWEPGASSGREVPVQREEDPPVRQYQRPTFNFNELQVPSVHKDHFRIDREQLISDMNAEIFGQEENIAKISHLVYHFLGSKGKDKPLTIFLYGSSGTGKTETAKKLVDAINKQLPDEQKYLYRPVDCTQYQTEADVSRLTGAAPGYVGHDEKGPFAILEDHPNVIYAFNEIEKAASNVTEVLMEAMDTGRQETNGKTLSNGESFYDLSHCIIFFTSNISLDEKKKRIGFSTEEESMRRPMEVNEMSIPKKTMIDTIDAKKKLVESGKFRKEVVGRMEAVMKYGELSGDAVKKIAAKSICDLAEKKKKLCVTEIEMPLLQEFINTVALHMEYYGARTPAQIASLYFGGPMTEYSFEHEDYALIKVGGTLENVIISPAS